MNNLMPLVYFYINNNRLIGNNGTQYTEIIFTLVSKMQFALTTIGTSYSKYIFKREQLHLHVDGI